MPLIAGTKCYKKISMFNEIFYRIVFTEILINKYSILFLTMLLLAFQYYLIK